MWLKHIRKHATTTPVVYSCLPSRLCALSRPNDRTRRNQIKSMQIYIYFNTSDQSPALKTFRILLFFFFSVHSAWPPNEWWERNIRKNGKKNMEHDNAKSKTNAKRAQKKNEDKRERKKCARHSGESLLANMCSRASESVVCRTLEKLTWRENVAPGSVWWWVMGWDGTRWQMPFLFAILQLCTHFNCRSIKQEARDHPPSSEPQASDGIHKRIFLLIIKFVSRVFSVVGTCKVLLWCRRRLHYERRYPTNEFQLISTHPTEIELPLNSFDWMKNLNNFDSASRCATVFLDISVFCVGAQQRSWCFTNLFFVSFRCRWPNCKIG